jgi:hypothetical protein
VPMAFAAITSALSSATPAVAASVDVLVSRAAGHEVYANWQLTNGPEWCVDISSMQSKKAVSRVCGVDHWRVWRAHHSLRAECVWCVAITCVWCAAWSGLHGITHWHAWCTLTWCTAAWNALLLTDCWHCMGPLDGRGQSHMCHAPFRLIRPLDRLHSLAPSSALDPFTAHHVHQPAGLSSPRVCPRRCLATAHTITQPATPCRPGAIGSLTAATDGLRIDFNFTGGGSYVGAMFVPASGSSKAATLAGAPAGARLRFRARASPPGGIVSGMLRVRDASGQSWLTSWRINASEGTGTTSAGGNVGLDDDVGGE